MTEHLRLVIGPTPITADAGSGEAQCLRVQRGNSDEWETFYDEIRGFEFVPGFTYELEVAVSRVDDPAPDTSALRYELVRVLNSTPADI